MATITEMRTMFRKVSGRADLTTADIDGYLNRGQRFLDQLTEFQKAPTRLQGSLSAGEMFVTFSTRMRVIYEVWAASSNGDKFELTKVSPRYIRATWPDPPSSISRGTPAYYTPDALRYYNASGVFQFYTGAFADSYDNNGVLVMPVADGDYEIEVTGRFYSTTLTDTSGSWWMEEQGELLLLSALRSLETHYRNTQGVKDWENSMAPLVNAVYHDLIEEDAVGISRMEG